jgi:hypothetical protein
MDKSGSFLVTFRNNYFEFSDGERLPTPKGFRVCESIDDHFGKVWKIVTIQETSDGIGWRYGRFLKPGDLMTDAVWLLEDCKDALREFKEKRKENANG